MIRLTVQTPTHFHLLLCADDVKILDRDTIEVAAPDWLEGGRMPVEAWMVRDLIEWDDHPGLEEIGIEVVASVSRASLN